VNRTPIILSLVGLALCVFGAYMMLRVLTSHGGMVNPTFHDDVAALRESAGPDVFTVYIALTASGFAIFAAGMAMLFGRYRQN
jgi:hypothetical protein